MPPPAHLREARAADVPRLIEIRAAVRENRLTDPARIAAPDYLPYITRRHLWLAEDAAGTPIAFAALDADGDSVWALFVAPEAERRGLGRLLLARLVEEARLLALPALTLETEAGSRAESLYRAAGWTVVGGDRGVLKMRLEL
jgi:GNAT superfamily N-acetyltransferase